MRAFYPTLIQLPVPFFCLKPALWRAVTVLPTTLEFRMSSECMRVLRLRRLQPSSPDALRRAPLPMQRGP